MTPVNFLKSLRAGLAVLAICTCAQALAETKHGIAMYGEPALPPDFVSLPYVNPDAPKGGRIVFGNTGGFDSLNPFVPKGTPPWQLRFLSYESLMGRSWDEPFTLYALLAESIRTAEDRSWVEFTLREEARFWDGTPVTVEDVIWSYETLGTVGHLRYRGLWTSIESIEQTGPRSVRLSFSEANRELALIAGLRPILKKAQWDGADITQSGLEAVPIGTGAYVPGDFEAGRFLELTRNPDYWGRDLPLRRGTQNLETIRIEFFGDQTVLFEAFKAGELTAIREFNAEKWATGYDFPAVQDGRVTLSEIPHRKPSGMTGFVMNTRKAPFDDWRVRAAMIHAYNFEFINDAMTGGVQPRISSYFSNSSLAMQPGPATGRVRELLLPFANSLLPGALEGYVLPKGDGSERNRQNLRKAMDLLEQAGWVVRDGQLINDRGEPFRFEILLRQGAGDLQTMINIYAKALERLGMEMQLSVVDDAQYNERLSSLDFDMTDFRRDLSLSPGNEQRLYWGSQGANVDGTRNLMGVASEAIDAMITQMLNAQEAEEFTAATRALDRVLTSGRYVVPIWQFDVGRIAHASDLKFPETLPIYGDGVEWLPHVWWSEAR